MAKNSGNFCRGFLMRYAKDTSNLISLFCSYAFIASSLRTLKCKFWFDHVLLNIFCHRPMEFQWPTHSESEECLCLFRGDVQLIRYERDKSWNRTLNFSWTNTCLNVFVPARYLYQYEICHTFSPDFVK